ncbi:hypothetical protein RND71_006315 [Anisodus tanguticus]|uniref:Uncharacterized protein n=1 Tax=Anisodus tanguticus TaxID=243964 RepID=A0AAE1VMB0_9SOLA|nr:hypothetical protein RND71_006315 [Anisodus tanguticus]
MALMRSRSINYPGYYDPSDVIMDVFFCCALMEIYDDIVVKSVAEQRSIEEGLNEYEFNDQILGLCDRKMFRDIEGVIHCILVILSLYIDDAFYDSSEIQEDNASHTRFSYHCFNPSDCPRLQWSMAQCYKVSEPLSAVSLVSLVGFGLYEFGFPGKNIFDRFAVLFTVIIVWIYAHLLTVGGAYNGKPPKTQASCRTDRAGLIDGASWISIPYPFQWGPPSFNAGEAFAMMMASFVALVEVVSFANSTMIWIVLYWATLDIVIMKRLSTGAFIAVARYASAIPLPPSILSRGVGWQGVGILLSGLFGTGNGSSVSVENAGLLALTRVGSRRVVQISAAFMIFFSILGKFGAVFASIPAPIVAALYCLFFAYVGARGLGFIQFCNLNSFRTKFILGFSIFLGLSIPQYFNEYTAVAGYGPFHTHARWFNDMVNVPFQSKAFVVGMVAFFLDNTMHKKDGQTRKDRGKHWWDKFKSFKTDTRSEEFYSLPFNMNKYFPSV